MKITHLQSATVILESNGRRILCDPWLVGGEYYGSWFHFPPFAGDIAALDYDCIYVSHIHPDHFSTKTAEQLDKTKPVLIHKHRTDFLKRNIERRGFKVIEVDNGGTFPVGGGLAITIFAADNCDPVHCAKFFGCAPAESEFGVTQIDSLAVFHDGRHVVVNTNDCPYALSRHLVQTLRERFGHVDMLMLGYASASPFPQCFSNYDENEKSIEAELLKRRFLSNAANYVRDLEPDFFMPFAGTYVLGGRLAHLNDYLALPRLHEALDWFREVTPPASEGVLLNGGESFDLATGTASAPYVPPSEADRAAFLEQISAAPFDFDTDAATTDAELLDAAREAHQRFSRKAQDLGLGGIGPIVVASTDGFAVTFDATTPPHPVDIAALGQSERLQLTLDRRLLARVLNGPRFAHWNNAEIGSHIAFLRIPNRYDRATHHALSFFHR